MTVMLHRSNILRKNEQCGLWNLKILWQLLYPFAGKGYKRTCHESSYPWPQKTIKPLWNEPKLCFQKQRSLILKVLSGSPSRSKWSVTRKQESSLSQCHGPFISFPERLNLNIARSDSPLSHLVPRLWWKAATSKRQDFAPHLHFSVWLQDKSLRVTAMLCIKKLLTGPGLHLAHLIPWPGCVLWKFLCGRRKKAL